MLSRREPSNKLLVHAQQMPAHTSTPTQEELAALMANSADLQAELVRVQQSAPPPDTLEAYQFWHISHGVLVRAELVRVQQSAPPSDTLEAY